jgi:cathepsin X
MGGHCSGLDQYPNATVAEFGDVKGADNMAKEIMTRGPIACGIDAAPILNYTGGVATDPGQGIDHIISVVGWGNGPGPLAVKRPKHMPQ